jgi:hypothetical protein
VLLHHETIKQKDHLLLDLCSHCLSDSKEALQRSIYRPATRPIRPQRVQLTLSSLSSPSKAAMQDTSNSGQFDSAWHFLFNLFAATGVSSIPYSQIFLSSHNKGIQGFPSTLWSVMFCVTLSPK